MKYSNKAILLKKVDTKINYPKLNYDNEIFLGDNLYCHPDLEKLRLSNGKGN